jgi:hypothetical protein
MGNSGAGALVGPIPAARGRCRPARASRRRPTLQSFLVQPAEAVPSTTARSTSTPCRPHPALRLMPRRHNRRSSKSKLAGISHACSSPPKVLPVPERPLPCRCGSNQPISGAWPGVAEDRDDARTCAHCPARCRVARGRWPRWVRLGHGLRHPHPPLSRPAAHRDHAADRPHGAGERPRGVAGDAGRPVCAERPALHARRGPSRWRSAHRRLPHRPLAHLDLPCRGRDRGQPGSRRLPRAWPRDRALAPLLGVGRCAADGPPAALGARLSRPAP